MADQIASPAMQVRQSLVPAVLYRSGGKTAGDGAHSSHTLKHPSGVRAIKELQRDAQCTDARSPY
jgi:hypothetical protein